MVASIFATQQIVFYPNRLPLILSTLSNISSIGDYAAIAGVANKVIKIYSAIIIVTGNVSLQIKSGTTVLEVLNLTTGTTIIPLSTTPRWTTVAGDTLNISYNTVGIVLTGHLDYIQG